MKHSKTKVLLLSVSVVFVVVMLIVPLISVLANSLAEGWDFYVKALTTPYVLSALRLTLIATVIAVAVNTFFGLCAAWAISKFDFEGNTCSRPSSIFLFPSRRSSPAWPSS